MAVDQNNDGLLDSFLQWRHLTNISTPENGWRVVFDISDVSGTKELQAGGPPLPNLIDDLSVPVEQWIDSLDYRVLFSGGNNLPGYSIGNTGAAAMVLGNFNRIQYEEQWARWSSPFTAFDRAPVLLPSSQPV